MKVIYAGFSKCGTKTVNAALTELGYNCFDYLENYEFLGNEWMKIFKEGGTTEDFRKMFENVDAVMDAPSYYFWEEIHKAFPDAKIIFSQRATEDIWWESFYKQTQANDVFIIKLMRYLSPSYWCFDQFGIAMCKCMAGIDLSTKFLQSMTVNELLLRKTYRAHNTYVLEKAPKDKLMIIDFADGWGPLCEFLGVPVPDTPFPHKNKKANITQEMMDSHPLIIRMQREMKISASLLVCLFGYGIYKLATRPSDSASLMSYITSPCNNFLEKLGY